MYVIIRTDQGGGYVADMAKSRNGASYTKKLQEARVYCNRDAALRDLCPGNEIVITVEDAMTMGRA